MTIQPSSDASGEQDAAGGRTSNDGSVERPAEPELPRWAKAPRPAGEVTDAQLAAYVGPRYAEVYRKKLAVFQDDPTFVPTWNWAAAVFSPVWFLYRKLYLGFCVFFLAPIVAFPLISGSNLPLSWESLLDPANERLRHIFFGMQLSLTIASGGTGNWLLFRRARAAARVVGLRGGGEADSLMLLGRLGGTNRGGTMFLLAVLGMMQLAQAWGARPG